MLDRFVGLGVGSSCALMERFRRAKGEDGRPAVVLSWESGRCKVLVRGDALRGRFGEKETPRRPSESLGRGD